VWRMPAQLGEMLIHDLLALRLAHVYIGVSSGQALLDAESVAGHLRRMTHSDSRWSSLAGVSVHKTVGMLQERGPSAISSEDGKDIAKLQFLQAVMAHSRAAGDDCVAVTDPDEIFVPRDRSPMSMEAILRAAIERAAGQPSGSAM